jgi:hypothetical protein
VSSKEEGSGENGGEEIDVEAVLAQPEEQNADPHDQPPDEDATRGGPPAHQAISANCLGTFTAVHSSGTRPLSRITHIIIHSTEGDTAAGAASWFANPRSGGSAHLVVDDHECFRTLDNDRIPFGAPGMNTNGFHIEHAGHASWERQRWMNHEQTLRRGAFKAAVHAVRFGIPLRLLSANDLRHGRKGFVTHATVSEVFPRGTHTDPGHGFPLDHYMQLVKEFAAEMQT